MRIEVYNCCTNKYFGFIDLFDDSPSVMLGWNQLSCDEGFYLGKLIVSQKPLEDGISVVELRRLKIDDCLNKRVLYYDNKYGTVSIGLSFRRVD